MFCLFFTAGPVIDLASAKRSDLEKIRALLSMRCLDRGVYFAPSQFETGFLSTAHSAADIETTARLFARRSEHVTGLGRDGACRSMQARRFRQIVSDSSTSLRFARNDSPGEAALAMT